jgi:hypothetical protein
MWRNGLVFDLTERLPSQSPWHRLSWARDINDPGQIAASGFIAGWVKLQGAVLTPAPHGDLDGSGSVGAADLGILLAAWGACGPLPAHCLADLNDDRSVDLADLLELLASWPPTLPDPPRAAS